MEFKITNRKIFQRIKFHTNIFTWLRDNLIWMRATSLKGNRNRNIGSILKAHLTYTNFFQAAVELMERMYNITNIKLIPHKHVWPRPCQWSHIKWCLQVTTSREGAWDALNSMMTDLSTNSPPPDYKYRPTANWKFTTFKGGDSLPKSAVEHLIIRQTSFLQSYNSSIYIENLQYVNKLMELTDPNRDSYQMPIHKIYMTELLTDNKPCIKVIT